MRDREVVWEVELMGPMGYAATRWAEAKFYTWTNFADGWDIEDGGGVVRMRVERGRVVCGGGVVWRMEWKL